MKIWDPAYDPYSSLLDQKCMFCRRGSTPDLNPIRQQRSETPVAVKLEQASLPSTLDKVGKRDTGL
ncbi:hypothetical protein J6590_084510 [Homalodisca vitripennis]|nr:hypothetical protein J6590_084510 [Homalodisca vitripennis]